MVWNWAGFGQALTGIPDTSCRASLACWSVRWVEKMTRLTTQPDPAYPLIWVHQRADRSTSIRRNPISFAVIAQEWLKGYPHPLPPAKPLLRALRASRSPSEGIGALPVQPFNFLPLEVF